jgi:site-specific DNA recombinase
MKIAAIYARVSTEKQEEQKTIESQLAELREACKRDGVKVFREYIDNGFSGETLARPALDELRDDAAKGLFEVVYIHSPDRLARKYLYQALVLEELTKRGIKVVFLNRPVTDNPEDQLLLGIQGLIAEYEKAKILERTRRGKLYKAKEKGIIGYIPPFGYTYVRRTPEREEHFEINRKEAEIVTLIFDLYLKFQSITRVQKELALRGIPTRKGRGVWSRSTIRDILRDEVYIGRGYFNKYQSVEREGGKRYRRQVKSGRRKRDRSEWIPLKFPPIVEERKFRLAQEILAKKYKPFGKSKYFYLLSGLIRCANCGSTFTGCKSGKISYYRCTDRRRRFPFPQECHARHIRAEDLESAIWNAVAKALSHPGILISHISHLADRATKSEHTLREEERRLLKEEENLLRKKDRLVELYTDGAINKDQFQRKMEAYAQEEMKIKGKIESIRSKLEQLINKPLILKNIEYLCDMAKQKLQNLNLEEKRRLLRYLIEKIILDTNKRVAKVIGHLPMEIWDLTQLFHTTPSEHRNVTLSMLSRDHGQYSKVQFEMEIKV